MNLLLFSDIVWEDRESLMLEWLSHGRSVFIENIQIIFSESRWREGQGRDGGEGGQANVPSTISITIE